MPRGRFSTLTPEERIIRNKEKAKEYRKKNRKKLSDAKRIWRAEKHDKHLAWSRKYRERNKEKLREWAREAAKKNPDKYNAYSRKKRAIKRNANHEPYTDTEILEIYGNNCHLCNEPIDLSAPRSAGKEGWQYSLHIDHLIPLSKGGDDNIKNVRPAHAICNLQKGDRIWGKM